MTKKKRPLDSSFEEWLKFYSPTIIGRMLGIRRTTVLAWLSRKTLPRPNQMRKIKTMTKGRIGYTEIIEGSCSPLTK